MADRNRNRSDSYQVYLLEVSVSPFVLGDLSCAQGMSYKLQSYDEKEKLLELREQLKKRLWEIINAGLTERQKQVIKLYIDEGLTQNEIAKTLGINQTSVHKVIRGNIDYKNGKKRYGGAFKKIDKLCQTDEEVQRILNEIKDLSLEL
jgi:RNA polymerase sigma factor (sigma-70 family)